MLRQRRISSEKDFRDVCEAFLIGMVSYFKQGVTDKPVMELAMLIEEELYKKVLYESPPDDIHRDTLWKAIKTTSLYKNIADTILQNLRDKASLVNIGEIQAKFQNDGKALLGYLLNDIKLVKDVASSSSSSSSSSLLPLSSATATTTAATTTTTAAPINKKRPLSTNTKKEKPHMKPRLSLSLKLGPPSSSMPPSDSQPQQSMPPPQQPSSSVSYDDDVFLDDESTINAEPEETSNHEYAASSSSESWTLRHASHSSDQSVGIEGSLGWGDASSEKQTQLEYLQKQLQERERIAMELKRERENEMEALMVEANEHKKTEEEKLVELEVQQRADREADMIRTEEEAAARVNLSSGIEALNNFMEE